MCAQVFEEVSFLNKSIPILYSHQVVATYTLICTFGCDFSSTRFDLGFYYLPGATRVEQRSGSCLRVQGRGAIYQAHCL